MVVTSCGAAPYTLELAERNYPNKRIAVSSDPDALLAAARLWRSWWES
jgi:hypothetical protein